MSTNNVESESKITFLIKFKKGNTVTLTDVKKVKVGAKIVGDEYIGDKIFTGIYPSTEDLTIQYSDGVFIVAQNTFETITIF